MPQAAWAGSKSKVVRAQRVSKAQTQAEPLVAEAAAAFAARDFAKAEHLLDSAYQKWQSPQILYQLGRVAAARISCWPRRISFAAISPTLLPSWMSPLWRRSSRS